MAAAGFFSSEFYEQVLKYQEIIDNLTEGNFANSLEDFLSLSYSNKNCLKTIASSLLNRIKIRPQDADLVIDFIEKHDETIQNDPSLSEEHSEIMPIFTKIVNPMPLQDHTYIESTIEIQPVEDDHFMPIPISECFIYENLRQRGHINFDLDEYAQFLKMKEKMPHLYPSYHKYEVNQDFSFVKTIQFIHLMPHTDYTDLVTKCEVKHYFDQNEVFKEFLDAKFTFRQLSQNDFELHKQYLREGFNPSSLPTAIRNDNIEEFEQFTRTQANYTKTISLSIYDCNILLKDANLLEYAAYYGSIEVFRYILDNAPNCDALFTPRLQDFAVIGGNEEIFTIVDNYFTRNQYDNAFENSLPFSLAFHHDIITEQLIYFKSCQTSPDVFKSIDIYSPTLNCFYFANWRDMHFLLHNDEGNLALFLLASAMFNNEEMFKNLLEIPKIDLNCKYDKMTPINFLIRYDNHELIYLLLEKGKISGERRVDINTKGFNLYSPIIYSCVYQLFNSFSVLINENDVDVNETYNFQDEYDKQNIMITCLKFRQFKMARMILNHPKFDVSQVIRLLPKVPAINNIMLSLNYLIEEKKRGKKNKLKKIDVSSLEV